MIGEEHLKGTRKKRSSFSTPWGEAEEAVERRSPRGARGGQETSSRLGCLLAMAN